MDSRLTLDRKEFELNLCWPSIERLRIEASQNGKERMGSPESAHQEFKSDDRYLQIAQLIDSQRSPF
jgi:hypothetical protein